MTTLPTVPPTSFNRHGERVWTWYDNEGDIFAVEETCDGAAVHVEATSSGAQLDPARCREAAAVLLALADEKEQR